MKLNLKKRHSLQGWIFEQFPRIHFNKKVGLNILQIKEDRRLCQIC